MDRFAALQTFVAVCETGSFSAAARRLRVGQPAVSKNVAQLEARLGVQLLLRSSRGLTPTEAGEAYYAYARRAVDDDEAAELAVRGASGGLVGRLRVCAAVTFARLHVIPHLPAFLQLHPDLDIDVVLDDRNIDLMGEGIDVALRMGDLASSEMTARKIASGPRAVVATPAYLAAAGIPRAPTDLVRHQAIIYDQGGGGSSWRFRRDAAELSVVVSGRLRVTAAEGVRAAVLQGMGVAITSEWMFSPELASGAVHRLLTDWTLPEIDLWAVFPTGRRASAKARAFTDFVEEAFDGARIAA